MLNEIEPSETKFPALCPGGSIRLKIGDYLYD